MSPPRLLAVFLVTVSAPLAMAGWLLVREHRARLTAEAAERALIADHAATAAQVALEQAKAEAMMTAEIAAEQGLSLDVEKLMAENSELRLTIAKYESVCHQWIGPQRIEIGRLYPPDTPQEQHP